MSVFLKPLLAFAVSILIFVGFYYLVDDEILVFFQTHFYHPAVVDSYQKENDTDAEHIQKYIWELHNKFTESLNNLSVRSSFLYNQSDEDIYERSRILGLLLETTMGLQYVQFIDTNGIRIHYSTYDRDIISQSQLSAAYRNYYEDPAALPFDKVSVPAGGSTKFTMDEQSDRIIFSFPFNDSMGVYRGTALFTVSVRSLAERLIAEGRLLVSEDVAVTNEPPGVLLGSPGSSKSDILISVSAIWMDMLQNQALQRTITVDAESSGAKFFLVSSRTDDGLFFGRLINEELFAIPDSMSYILNLSIVLTFFLSFYFLLNLKPNAVTLVRVRIKRLRESLFEQLYINKTGSERAKWILQLEQRRDEIRAELKFNLKLRAYTEKIIDNIIDKSWDGLLDILKSGSGAPIVIADTAQPAVDEALSAGYTKEIPEAVGEIEAIDDIEEIESLEEIEEIKEAEAFEELEEVEALEEIETLDDVEEISGTDETETMNVALADHTCRGLLAAASKGVPASRGLLAAASNIIPRHQGLLALANKIEFSKEYPVKNHPEKTLDIVSPFSSLFSSLNDDN